MRLRILALLIPAALVLSACVEEPYTWHHAPHHAGWRGGYGYAAPVATHYWRPAPRPVWGGYHHAVPQHRPAWHQPPAYGRGWQHQQRWQHPGAHRPHYGHSPRSHWGHRHWGHHR